jgi:hypothetical protein
VKREGVMHDGLMVDGGRTPLNLFPNEWTRIFSSFGSEELQPTVLSTIGASHARFVEPRSKVVSKETNSLLNPPTSIFFLPLPSCK